MWEKPPKCHSGQFRLNLKVSRNIIDPRSQSIETDPFDLYEGSTHPLATVDRSRIPAFARLGFSYDAEGQAETEAHADG
ncbi:MAG: hypothetical protein M3H12_20860, partial [Chromatiales bacterium]